MVGHCQPDSYTSTDMYIELTYQPTYDIMDNYADVKRNSRHMCELYIYQAHFFLPLTAYIQSTQQNINEKAKEVVLFTFTYTS